MAKQGMTHPNVTRGPKNDVSPVPQIQGKAKSGKEKAKPILPETTGANQKVWHEIPISKAHGIIVRDMGRDSLEPVIPPALKKCRARQKRALRIVHSSSEADGYVLKTEIPPTCRNN